jgi:hypothetical protein
MESIYNLLQPRMTPKRPRQIQVLLQLVVLNQGLLADALIGVMCVALWYLSDKVLNECRIRLKSDKILGNQESIGDQRSRSFSGNRQDPHSRFFSLNLDLKDRDLSLEIAKILIQDSFRLT